MGVNLNAVSYFSPEWAFVDVMKSSRMGKHGRYPWDLVNPKGLAAPKLDANGWPLGLGDGQSVWTPTMVGLSGHYPGGNYTVMFEGEGEVELDWDAERTRHSNDGAQTARFTVPVTPTDTGIVIRILRSNPSNHVRNVRVIMPGFESKYESEPFHPLFLQRLAPFTVLRFMDWGDTNHSPVRTWAERRVEGYRTHHRGAAYEVMAKLCNTLDKHAWICIPHKANDEYVRKTAALLKERLEPNLKVFVEYSNEVWNGAFDQADHVRSWASGEGKTWQQWYARRSVEIFKIFEEVLGAERAITVLGSQAASPGVSQAIVSAAGGKADALAIAPYFGGKLGTSSQAGSVRGWSVSQVLDACQEDLARWRDKVRQQQAIAKGANMTLIAYEGGQHLVGVGSYSNDTQLRNLFIKANRNARMGAIYRDYFANWLAEGGGVFCVFNYVKTFGKSGSWGILEYQDQTDAPKYDAVVDVANQWKAR